MVRALLPLLVTALLPAADVAYPGLTRDGHLMVGQAWLGQEVRILAGRQRRRWDARFGRAAY